MAIAKTSYLAITCLCLLLLTAPATSDTMSPAATSDGLSPPSGTVSSSSNACLHQCVAAGNWRAFCNLRCFLGAGGNAKTADESGDAKSP